MQEQELIERAKAFVAVVSAAAPREAIEAFCAEDIVQEEFPNLLRPQGAVRDFINWRAVCDRARYSLASQSNEVINAVAQGNCVIVETKWTAAFAVNFGKLVPGDTVRARVVHVLEFRDGLIVHIRSYYCFEPFPEKSI